MFACTSYVQLGQAITTTVSDPQHYHTKKLLRAFIKYSIVLIMVMTLSNWQGLLAHH